MARELRNTAHEIFAHALSDSSIDRAFERHVFYDRGILRIVEDLYDLSSYARVFVAAIGKAAHTMVESLMGRIGPGAGISGIVCAPVLPQTQVFANVTRPGAQTELFDTEAPYRGQSLNQMPTPVNPRGRR